MNVSDSSGGGINLYISTAFLRLFLFSSSSVTHVIVQSRGMGWKGKESKGDVVLAGGLVEQYEMVTLQI